MTVEVKLTFASLDEATAFFASKQAPVSTSAPAPTKPAKTAAAADTKQPAAPQPSPAQEQKESASEKPAAAETKAELPTYEKSGIGEKIANYLGDKTTEGYAARRGKMIELLTEFNAKSGKDLKPEQFGDFTAKLNAIIGPEEALG